MAYYGGIYRSYFNSINEYASHEFKLEIYKKDFYGDVTDIQLGAEPVIQEWQDDEVQKPIKGSSLRISIINEGNISLDDFYSNEDDTFQVVLYKIDFADEVLFKGFIIQDDCAEIMVDYAHEISISATDNLGVLKNYTFDQAAIKFGPYSTSFALDIQTSTNGTINNIIVNENFDEQYTKIVAGNKIEISGGTFFDGIYTVLGVTANGSFSFVIQVKENVGGNSPSTLCNLTYQVPYDISSFLSVKEILKLCILSTNVNLEELRVVSKIKPYGKDRWIDDTFIDCKSYINNNVYQDCYKILEDLMSRFRASLFQAYGFWYIVRIGEFSMCNDYSNYLQFTHRYEASGDFDYITSGNEDRYFLIDTNGAENGVIKSILRPYNYSREDFNYTANQNLLPNGDLQELGNFITSYTSGTDTYFEYEAPKFDFYFSNSSEMKYYIRIVFNSDNEETDRYLVLQSIDNQDVSTDCIVSRPISLLKGDVITVKYNTRTSNSHSANTNQISRPFLRDAASFQIYLRYANDTFTGSESNGTWTTNNSFNNSYVSTEDSINWKTIIITSNPAPFDGLFYLSFSFISNYETDNTETYFNNLSVTIGSLTNTQSNIIGHYHKTISNIEIKNSEELSIELDDSKSNSISGTLFLSTETDDIRDRIQKWDYEGTCEKEYTLNITSGIAHPVGDAIVIVPPFPSDITWANYPTGTQFVISGGTPIDGTYTVDVIDNFLGNLNIVIVESTIYWSGEATLTFNKPFSAVKLGQHTTFEQMYLRWKTRPKLDINILNAIGIYSSFFGPLHIVKFYAIQDVIFFLGSISISYRNNSAKCTMYGLVNETEKRSDLETVSSYEFNYLYENS